MVATTSKDMIRATTTESKKLELAKQEILNLAKEPILKEIQSCLIEKAAIRSKMSNPTQSKEFQLKLLPLFSQLEEL